MSLSPFVGPIYLGILVVDCIFFMFLERFMPPENIDYVRREWDVGKFRQVRATLDTGMHSHLGAGIASLVGQRWPTMLTARRS